MKLIWRICLAIFVAILCMQFYEICSAVILTFISTTQTMMAHRSPVAILLMVQFLLILACFTAAYSFQNGEKIIAFLA